MLYAWLDRRANLPIHNANKLSDILSGYDLVRCPPQGYDVRRCSRENVSHFKKASCAESRASETGIRTWLSFAMRHQTIHSCSGAPTSEARA